MCNEPDSPLEEHELGARHAPADIEHHDEVNRGTAMVEGWRRSEADEGGELIGGL